MIWSLPFGLLVGISLGALGGGGSILTVPVLVYVLGEKASTATTTSLVVVGLTALIGAGAHWRAGRVRLRQGVIFGLLGIVGAWLGSYLSAAVDPKVLLGLFAVLMLVVAVLMGRRALRGASAADSGAGDHSASGTNWVKVIATASGVGLLTGFFGVGGGFAVVPALVLALDFSMPVAVGTSLVVIAINSGSALAARAAGGVHIDLGVVVAFTAAAIVGSLFGGRLAHKISPRHLTLAFSVLLVGVGIYTGVRSLAG